MSPCIDAIQQQYLIIRPPNIVVGGLGFTAILSIFYLSSFLVSYPASSLNGTQHKPATCSEVSAIAKYINQSISQSFLPRDAMLARYYLSSCVCLSVRLSVRLFVTSRSCTKMAKPRIRLTTPYDSPETLVFQCQKFWRNSHDITPNGGAK